jgi:hypothetical protein
MSLDGPILKCFGFGKFDPISAEERELLLDAPAGLSDIVETSLSSTEKENSVAHTITNFIGYLPLVGIIAGVAHFILGKDLLDNPRTLKPKSLANRKISAVTYILRGIVECLSLGALLAPFDFGCSAARLVRDFLNRDHRSVPEKV